MRLVRCNKRAFILITVLALLSREALAAKALSLPNLEDMLDASREVEIATAEIEERIYLLKRERLRRGVKLFANAGYSDVSEVVTDDLRREYQRRHMTMGLSYPLFGTHAIEKNAVLEAEDGLFASEQRREITRRRALSTLRRSYVDYWSAIQRIKVSRQFLSIEPDTHNWLTERTKTGHLLEADRLEFMTAFDLARRSAASDEEIRSRSHSAMALLTEDSLHNFEPEPPQLPNACLDKVALEQQAIQQHPEIKLLRARLETIRSLRKRSTDIEANVNLSASVGQDEPSSLSDNGLALSVNVRMPLEFLSTRKYSRYAKSAELRRANLELDKRSQEVRNGIRSAIGRYRTAIENLSFAETRVAAALETIRERQLRAASLAGDTLEKLQQAKFGAYRTSIDLIDAEGLLLKSTIGILALSESSCLEQEPDIHIEPEHEPLILTRPLPRQWASTLNLQPLSPSSQFAVPSYTNTNSTAKTLNRASPGNSGQVQSKKTIKIKSESEPWPTSLLSRVYYDVIMPRPSQGALLKKTRTEIIRKPQNTDTWKPVETKPVETVVAAAIKSTEIASTKTVRAKLPRRRVHYEDARGLIKASFTPPAKAPSITAVQETMKQSEAPVTGTYLWKSRRIISDEKARQKLWKNLEEKKISRVLLSLDGHQIRATKNRKQKMRLHNFLAEAKQQGISVELLLGEPTWVLESHRERLLDIVQQLSELEFSGLHLDIEPGMFDSRLHDRKQILKQLGDTVESVIAISPWPVSMSLHYRDLDATQPYCLGCRLTKLDIAEVTLMIYVSNPERVAEIARRIARRNPTLRFSIAQSVEPILNSEESHANVSLPKLEMRLSELRSKLEPYSINGILLQSWSDLEEMSQ